MSVAQADCAVSARELSVRSATGRIIVDGLSLDVDRGEAVGIVGESGSGKSMTARALMGLLPAGLSSTGQVYLRGRELLQLREREMRRVRGSEIGFVMQDPFTMLNPLARCGTQIMEGVDDGRTGRRSRRRARADEAVRRLAEVGIRNPDVADRYPFQLSGGMRQRVAIAAALARNPQVLIADEPTTALDVTSQKEILDLIQSLSESRRMSLLLITHDLRVATDVCDRIYVMYAGSILEASPAEELDSDPRHPYSLGLLRSEPPVSHRLGQLAAVKGAVPRPDDVANCCPFAPRCEWGHVACRSGRPPLDDVSDEARSRGPRLSACIRSSEIHEAMRAARTAVAPAEFVPRHGVPSMVIVNNLVKSYPAGGRNRPALDGVSMQIGLRESIGLVGESGSGKTTLGRCLIGLERPTAGSIEIDGLQAANFAHLSRRDRAELRRKVQMVFQDPYSTLNPARTVGATLEEAIRARDSAARGVTREVGRLLNRVGLPEAYAVRKPVALSGGERQRVAIARALAIRPRLIVCDEPVSALDVSVQAQVLNLLSDLREEYEVSYLFITHDLAVVRQIAERIYVLREGHIVESGACSAVLDNPRHDYTKKLVASIPGPRSTTLRTGERSAISRPT